MCGKNNCYQDKVNYSTSWLKKGKKMRLAFVTQFSRTKKSCIFLNWLISIRISFLFLRLQRNFRWTILKNVTAAATNLHSHLRKFSFPRRYLAHTYLLGRIENNTFEASEIEWDDENMQLMNYYWKLSCHSKLSLPFFACNRAQTFNCFRSLSKRV